MASEAEQVKQLDRDKYLEKRRKYYADNKEKYKEWNKKWRSDNIESDTAYKKKYKTENAETIKIKSREYNNRTNRERYLKHVKNIGADQFNKKQRERRSLRSEEQRNRDKEYAKKYRIENAEKIKQYHFGRKNQRRTTRKEYFHKKYRSDIEYKLLHNLRSRIKNALKLKAKDSTTIRLLGCTVIKFKQHIERLFIDGMTWGGVFSGDIHIDHIKPCKKFDLSKISEQKLCFHYTNLQPLWKLDNLKKGAKYPH